MNTIEPKAIILAVLCLIIIGGVIFCRYANVRNDLGGLINDRTIKASYSNAPHKSGKLKP